MSFFKRLPFTLGLLLAPPALAAEPSEEQCAALHAAVRSGVDLREAVIASTTRASELLEEYLTRQREHVGEPDHDELVRIVGQATALLRQPLDRHSSEPVARAEAALRALCPKPDAP